MTENEAYEIDRRLVNWARWCRDNKTKGRCRSIESRYDPRSDAMDGEEVVVHVSEPYFAVDGKDAVLVNRAWQVLPLQNNKLIVAHYIPRRRHPRQTCKDLGIKFRDYDDQVVKAQIMLRNLLRFLR